MEVRKEDNDDLSHLPDIDDLPGSLTDVVLLTQADFTSGHTGEISAQGLIWIVILHDILVEREFFSRKKQLLVIDTLVEAIRENADKIREIEMKQVAQFYDSYQWTKDVLKSFFKRIFPQKSDIDRNLRIQKIETRYIGLLSEFKWKDFIRPSSSLGMSFGLMLSFSPFAFYELTDNGEKVIEELKKDQDRYNHYTQIIFNPINLALNIIITEFRQLLVDAW